MNNINFTARLAFNCSPASKNNPKFQSFTERSKNISDAFKKRTINSPDDTLLVDRALSNDTYDFILLKDKGAMVEQAEAKLPLGDIETMGDDEVLKRLTDVFDAMKLKAMQNGLVNNLRDNRAQIDTSYKKRIEELKAQGKNADSLEIARMKAFAANTEKLYSLSRINGIEFNSFLISKGLVSRYI